MHHELYSQVIFKYLMFIKVLSKATGKIMGLHSTLQSLRTLWLTLASVLKTGRVIMICITTLLILEDDNQKAIS